MSLALAAVALPPPPASFLQRAPMHARSALGVAASSSQVPYARASSASSNSSWAAGDEAASSGDETAQVGLQPRPRDRWWAGGEDEAAAMPPSPQTWPPLPRFSPPPPLPPPDWRLAPRASSHVEGQLQSHHSPPSPPNLSDSLTYLPPPSAPPWSPPLPPPAPRHPALHFCHPCTGPISSAVLEYTEAITGLLLMAFAACIFRLAAADWLGDSLRSPRGNSIRRGAAPVAPQPATQHS